MALRNHRSEVLDFAAATSPGNGMSMTSVAAARHPRPGWWDALLEGDTELFEFWAALPLQGARYGSLRCQALAPLVGRDRSQAACGVVPQRR